MSKCAEIERLVVDRHRREYEWGGGYSAQSVLKDWEVVWAGGKMEMGGGGEKGLYFKTVTRDHRFRSEWFRMERERELLSLVSRRVEG